MHMPELGITSEKRRNLKTQKDYDRLFEDYQNTTLKNNSCAINKLYQIFLNKKRVAITCFEANVCMCHRGQLALALTQLSDWKYELTDEITEVDGYIILDRIRALRDFGDVKAGDLGGLYTKKKTT